jgi:hypothetical protein
MLHKTHGVKGCDAIGTLIEQRFISRSPPLNIVAKLIVQTTAVVKTMDGLGKRSA